MKHYTYRSSHYMIQMTVPGIATLLIALYSVYVSLSGGFNYLWAMILVVSVYNTWNTFVSGSTPSEISIDDENLAFTSYGRTHTYKIKEIKKFAMRTVAGGDRLYMTINNGGLMHGRYWVRLSGFNDEEELNTFFYKLDARVNPNSIFTTARKQGFENQKKKNKKYR